MTRAAAFLRCVWTIYYMHLKQIVTEGSVVFLMVVQPLIVALLAIYMLRGSQGFQAIYVIVGSALTGLWAGTIYVSSRGIDRERWTGTLEETLGSPTNMMTVAAGKSLANLTLSLGSMFISYPVAAFLFGFQLKIAEPLWFAFSLLLAILALVSMGLVIAPAMSLNPGSAVWSNAYEFPMYVVGGFLFPISLLPVWTTPISYALPPYWAARALHATSSDGASFSEISIIWALLIVSSIASWFFAAWLFRIFMRRAQVEATLGLQ